MTHSFTPGRILILVGNLVYSIGAFIADYNETHVKNPRWPPHAKFHNGQTMTLGVLLASTSLFFLFRPAVSVARQKENMLYAAVVGSFYCAAGLSAILYPGTAWQDPEFAGGGEQRYIFGGVCGMMLVGYGLEHRKLAKAKDA
ncbi:uncharacterized protein RCC_08906 [Ramularia collo-cygni]|uniref:Acetyltransferase n=1 Tax=Ramularia collo-cygni TaxID=112498 RepID=A0A2D3V1C6_9PEZI|nr:uncharacterized protein RCC_08906 [Ramularia collo-cygni]CZT23196.1 uncharacterized protein RCC_08906 [Ramularia collo-cygni]